MKILDSHFDTVELRAARTMAEADYYFKHQPCIVAARLDLPLGILSGVSRMLDKVLMKEKAL